MNLEVHRAVGALTVRTQTVCVGLFLLSLFGLYTQFHLYSGSSILFPFIVSNFIGMFAFIVHIRSRNTSTALIAVIALFAFSVIALGSAIARGYFDEALSKYFQLIWSVLAGYGLCTLILHIPRSRLRKILLWLSWGILFVAIAETYFGFYNTMIEINSSIYAWRPDGFYINATRDLDLWGAVRPLVFSTEPSLVGIWGSVFMVGATMLSPNENASRYVLLIMYVVALLFVARSTTAILILVSYLLASLFDQKNSLPQQVALLATTLAIAVIMIFTQASTLIGQYMLGTSFFARIVGPYLTSIEVIKQYPLFGIGLGNEVELSPIVMGIWQETGMLSASAQYVQEAGFTGLLTNNFFWIWINLGLIGGSAFLAIVLFFVQGLGKFSATLVLLTTFGAWMTVGGFVDLRTWFFLYFFIGCAILGKADRPIV